MTVLRTGDEDLHYPDGLHRWLSPGRRNGTWEQETSWSERVHAHRDAHDLNKEFAFAMGGVPCGDM